MKPEVTKKIVALGFFMLKKREDEIKKNNYNKRIDLNILE